MAFRLLAVWEVKTRQAYPSFEEGVKNQQSTTETSDQQSAG
jgi:hypothetical protein